MDDDKKKSFLRKKKENLLAFSRRHPRTLKWLEKRLAKQIEISDEKYKEFNQTPLYKFYSTEAATRLTPSMHYDRYAENQKLKFPDNSVYLVYVVKGNVKAVRQNQNVNSKKQFTRIVTFNRGTYFYKVRGGKSELKSGEENTVILASRVNSMFDVAMRYRKSETNAVQPPVLIAATLNVEDLLTSIPFFRKVVGSSKISEVASFAKMEIHAEGDRIITQGEPLESCWILLAGKAAMSVYEDKLTSFEGESSMSILENCLDAPLEAFRTERLHMSKKLNETDVSFRPISEPKLRTEIACKIATFPETKLSTKYAFDSRRFRIKSRTISNFPQKDIFDIKEEKRREKKRKKIGSVFFQHDESKVGAPEFIARMNRRYGSLPKMSPVLPQDDEMTRWFKMGMYEKIGMHKGVKIIQRANEKDTSNVPLYPGSHFGSIELCGLTAKVSKFTVDVTEASVWLRIHKKSFVKFLSYEKDIKFRFYQFMNLKDASVRKEFQYNLWKDVENGGSVAGDAVCYAPKISSMRQLKYGRGVEDT